MLAKTERADLHRLLGDLDERLGDPLEAVRDYEQAVRLDPGEQNYFEWGTELFLHRAILPAVEVFTKGSIAHPNSVRMLTGLGAALYASGVTDKSAERLCHASDLDPAASAPYIFLGKIEEAATVPPACGAEKLARFMQSQPGNALARYYYALALLKGAKASGSPASTEPAEALLQKAVSIDPKLAEAYFQLGNLYSERGNNKAAVSNYQKALEANPQMGEAHYRLGLIYKHMGYEAKAHEEFQAHLQVEKTQADAIERQRREVRQFLVVLKEQPRGSGEK
jgi:tetratricopeptide (TPR) repeat protein